MYGKNFDFKKKKGSSKKMSYERRAYDSVDDRPLLGCISKINEKNSGTNGLLLKKFVQLRRRNNL